MGRAGRSSPRSTGSAGWTGLVLLRAALHRRSSSAACPAIGRRRGLGARARRCSRWRRSSSSAVALGAAAAAHRDGALRASSCCSSPTAARIPVGCGRSRSSCSSGPTSTAASSSVRSCSGWPGSRTSTTTCRSRTGSWSVAVGLGRWPRASRRSGRRSGPTPSGLSTNPPSRRGSPSGSRPRCATCPASLFFGSAMAVVALIARRGTTTAWPTLAWLAVFFVIGAYAIRGVAWWPLGAVAAIAGVLVTGPAVRPGRARHGPRMMRRAQRRRSRGRSCSSASPSLPVWRPLDPALGAPQGVVGRSRRPGSPPRCATLARPGDRLFNPQPWGSWFEFALPDLPVAIDSRIELFPTSVWDTYDSIVSGGEAGRPSCASGASRSWSWRTRTRPSPRGCRRPAGTRRSATPTAPSSSRRDADRAGRYQRSARTIGLRWPRAPGC